MHQEAAKAEAEAASEATVEHLSLLDFAKQALKEGKVQGGTRAMLENDKPFRIVDESTRVWGLDSYQRI